MLTRVDVGIFFIFWREFMRELLSLNKCLIAKKKSPCEMLQLSQGVKNKTFSDIVVIIM